jgi:hypothetical protein
VRNPIVARRGRQVLDYQLIETSEGRGRS